MKSVAWRCKQQQPKMMRFNVGWALHCTVNNVFNMQDDIAERTLIAKRRLLFQCVRTFFVFVEV